MPSRVAVVGAGPAGLTAALALRRLGLEVTVFEQAQDYQRIGGGIVLHDNGQRVLAALGLLDSFRPYLQPCRVIAAQLCEGRILGGVDFGRLSPPLRHLPAVVLRHQLQEHLLAAARACGVEVRFGHRVAAASAAGDAAVLGFADGTNERVGIVLACDGAGSATRASLRLPARQRRLRQAYVRGVADLGWPQPQIRELWYPDGRIFGTAPLPDARTYFWCTAPRGRWPQTLHGGLEGWIASWAGHPKPGAVLGAVRDWNRVNYDEPLEVQARCWCRPPVFLVGDAAHAMTPYLGARRQQRPGGRPGPQPAAGPGAPRRRRPRGGGTPLPGDPSPVHPPGADQLPPAGGSGHPGLGAGTVAARSPAATARRRRLASAPLRHGDGRVQPGRAGAAVPRPPNQASCTAQQATRSPAGSRQIMRGRSSASWCAERSSKWASTERHRRVVEFSLALAHAIIIVG